MLAQYVADTQNLLNDQQGQFFPIPTLHNYINRSRRRVAASSGCLRVVPHGVVTIANQEIYPFSSWKSLVQQDLRGVRSILHCRSVAIAIGGKWQQQDDGTWIITGGAWKPAWRRVVWTDFQARFRIYGRTFYGTISEPGWWAQFNEGELGSIYLAPIPSQQQPMELDLTCIPENLLTDKDPECIPYPWTDAVVWWAAVLALLQQQRAQDADAMAKAFNAEMPFAAALVCPQMVQTAYGAALRSA
jgi:hypothetical protein